MTATQINNSRPTPHNADWFDVGDVLHSIAGFWSHERQVRIQVKSPMGLRSDDNEQSVRAAISRVVANATAPDRATVLVGSELNGQVRVSVQVGPETYLLVFNKLQV